MSSCVDRSGSLNIGEIELGLFTFALALSHVLIPDVCTFVGCDNHLRIYLEAITLAATVVAGAVIGIVLGVRWAPKMQNKNRMVIEGSLMVSISFAAWAYVSVQDFNAEKFGAIEYVIEAITLAIMIWAGAMLGAHYGTRAVR